MGEQEASDLLARLASSVKRLNISLTNLGQQVTNQYITAQIEKLKEDLPNLTPSQLAMVYKHEVYHDLLESNVIQQKRAWLQVRADGEQLAARHEHFLQLVLTGIASIMAERRYQAFGFAEAPGWLILRLSNQPFHPILKASLVALTSEFSAQEIGTIASTLYFQPRLWWEHAQTLPEIQLQACMRTILNACVIYYATPDLPERLEQRLIQLIEASKNPDIENCYLLPKEDLQDCMTLFMALPYSQQSLNILTNLQSLDYDTGYQIILLKYAMSLLIGDNPKNITILLSNFNLLDEDILCHATTLMPYEVINHLGPNHPWIRIIFRRLIEDFSPLAADVLARNREHMHGKEYLLEAARLHQAYNVDLYKIGDKQDSRKAAIASMAQTDGIEELNQDERQGLIRQLKTYSQTTLTAILPLATHAQDLIIEALEWQQALPLLALIKRLANAQYMTMNDIYSNDMPNSADPASGEIDVEEINAVVKQAGEPLARKVVSTFQAANIISHTCLMIAASQGWEKQLEKSLKHGNQIAIKAYGIAPITRGKEEVLERYLKLQETAKQAKKYGPQRRVNHTVAVEVGLSNLARSAGYPDVSFLEWNMEVQIANGDGQDSGHRWQIGDYLLEMQIKDLVPTLSASRGPRQYKTIPKEVREHPTYQAVKEKVRLQREQISRLRSRYLEQLISSERLIEPQQLRQIIQMPTARILLEGLILGTEEGQSGTFDAGRFALRDLQNELQSITQPVKVVHPYSLFQAGTLSAWQRTIIQRQIVQPIKQVFRELYILTPAEQGSSPYSQRFAGHSIAGHITSKLLSARGWRQNQSYDGVTPYKVFPGVTAIFNLQETGPYLGLYQNAYTDHIYFQGNAVGGQVGRTIELSEVPPLIFSEAMRDADLIVSVAATQQDGRHGYSDEFYARRRELIDTLFADLNLPRVTVEGHFAHIQGKLARYRIHLLSAAIHIEPGNYLCIVPQSWGKQAPNLFLPFANTDDPKLSEVISKILLLLADDQIKDESILQQIRS